MDVVNCKGTEENLTQCAHNLENSCKHSEDVGVICQSKFKPSCQNNCNKII